MLEKTYAFARSDAKTIEKVVDDERVNINHIVLAPGEAVPVHVSNSFVHQIVVRGELSLSLEDGPVEKHTAGTIVSVPFNLKMAIRNEGPGILEFFVIKVPNPRDMPPVKAM